MWVALEKARDWFYEQAKSGKFGLDVPEEHLMALGTALFLTIKVKEKDSRNITGRRGWKWTWKTAKEIIPDDNFPQPINSRQSELAYRILDHAIKLRIKKLHDTRVRLGRFGRGLPETCPRPNGGLVYLQA